MFDSLIQPFSNSSYFLCEKIQKVITGLHDKMQKIQNRSERSIDWFQPIFKYQKGNDWGTHARKCRVPHSRTSSSKAGIRLPSNEIDPPVSCSSQQ